MIISVFLFYPHDELFQPAPAHQLCRSPLLSSQTLASASISPFLRRALELSIDKAPSRSTPQTAVVMLKSHEEPYGSSAIPSGNQHNQTRQWNRPYCISLILIHLFDEIEILSSQCCFFFLQRIHTVGGCEILQQLAGRCFMPL